MENNERKNFHIETKRSEWKVKRTVAKIEAANAKYDIEQEAEDRIREIETEAAARIREVKDEARRHCIDQDIKLANVLTDISKEQDAYEHEFRCYIASLPDKDKIIETIMKGGSK